VANGYTAAVQGNAVDRYLRERSRPRIIATMAERDPLLEIGCGTGLETLDVMRAGHHVTAVDISPNMLAELTARADRAGLRPFLTTVRGALNTIDSSLAAAPDSSFRGAYSTFGALNIEPDLVPLGRALGRVLASGSPFFAGVLSRTAIVPQLWQWAAGHPEEARARSRCPIPASGARFPLQLYPLGAAELQTALGDQFRLRRVEAASVLAPPTDYPKARRRTPPAMRRSAARVDSALARIPGVRGWGDWLFLTFERR
jgi:SAM-dependent methyltransferase